MFFAAAMVVMYFCSELSYDGLDYSRSFNQYYSFLVEGNGNVLIVADA